MTNLDDFSLESVVSSKKFAPLKLLVYGVPGIGKTTFASTFPKPILLRTEDGANALDVPTFPKVAKNVAEVKKAITMLAQNEHDYKTLIIDSLDWLEPLLWKAVCVEGAKENIEDFGFGKGYIKVDDKWRELQAYLDRLRVVKKMHIVVIAHAVAATMDLPDQEPFQKYTVKLHKRAASLWTEWSEIMLFANYAMNVVKDKDSAKRKAYGSGDRVLYTQERPAYMAKSRLALPESIMIGKDDTWAEFHKALNLVTDGEYVC